MKNSGNCPVCGHIKPGSFTKHYARCSRCRHEIIQGDVRQAYIINDLLDEKEVNSFRALDRFKRYVVMDRIVSGFNELLLDVGSASGKFLLHNQNLFQRVVGLEITPKALDFSRKFGLEILEDVTMIEMPVSMVTFWHSLEHIPMDSMDKILSFIYKNSTEQCRVIVSVPNRDSLQYALFGGRFAYYDYPSHIHQFSSMSLRVLMKQYGFIREKSYYSFDYSVFGYLQGFLNFLNKRHNFLYYWKKRGCDFGLGKIKLRLLELYNLSLCGIFFLPALGLACVDRFFLKRQGVLTICFKKEKR